MNAKVQRQLRSGKRRIAKRLARRAKAGRTDGPQFSQGSRIFSTGEKYRSE